MIVDVCYDKEREMLPIEREKYIADMVSRNTVVKVEDLAKKLKVSEITIRRDLNKMEQEGVLSRTRGGAVSHHLRREEPFDHKLQVNHEVKKKIAEAAYELIEEGSTIILDSGTTTYELALMLRQRSNITVVTDDLKIAYILCDAEVRTFIAGGEIQRETGSVFGHSAEEYISNIRVDLAFLGTPSIDAGWDLFTPTMEKAVVKRTMMSSAFNSVLLADNTKFGSTSFSRICNLTDFDFLVSDKEFSPEEKERLEKGNIVHVPVSTVKPEETKGKDIM